MSARAPHRWLFGAAVILAALMTAAPGSAQPIRGQYQVRNLVSNVAGVADNVDPNLVNAWGLAAGPTSPWWVSDNGTDRSTLYNPAGTPLPLVVSVPGAPTGTVFTGAPGSFLVGAANASFIFATEAGTILGWNGGTAATVEADRSPAGAVYKGLAIAQTPA